MEQCRWQEALRKPAYEHKLQCIKGVHIVTHHDCCWKNCTCCIALHTLLLPAHCPRRHSPPLALLSPTHTISTIQKSPWPSNISKFHQSNVRCMLLSGHSQVLSLYFYQMQARTWMTDLCMKTCKTWWIVHLLFCSRLASHQAINLALHMSADFYCLLQEFSLSVARDWRSSTVGCCNPCRHHCQVTQTCPNIGLTATQLEKPCV
jgi:hypothetical protein